MVTPNQNLWNAYDDKIVIVLNHNVVMTWNIKPFLEVDMLNKQLTAQQLLVLSAIYETIILRILIKNANNNIYKDEEKI